MKNWQVQIPKQIEKKIAKLPDADRRRILCAIEQMKADPFAGDVMRVQSGHADWRRRVGNYRVLYDSDKRTRVVVIVSVARRTTSTYRSVH